MRAELLDLAGAQRFATRYADAMAAKHADDRWTRSAVFFAALVDGTTMLAEVQTAVGGAGAVFLVAGAWASYAFSVRWGAAGPATTLVVHEACRVLADRGVAALTLGGGVGDASDDSLLAFKRSWGGRAVPFRIGARVYVPEAHAALVEAGVARPLPAGAVRP